jgi:hypothetical protein
MNDPVITEIWDLREYWERNPMYRMGNSHTGDIDTHKRFWSGVALCPKECVKMSSDISVIWTRSYDPYRFKEWTGRPVHVAQCTKDRDSCNQARQHKELCVETTEHVLTKLSWVGLASHFNDLISTVLLERLVDDAILCRRELSLE